MSNLEPVAQAQRAAVVLVTLAMVSVSVALVVLVVKGSPVEVPWVLSLILLGLATGRHAISSR